MNEGQEKTVAEIASLLNISKEQAQEISEQFCQALTLAAMCGIDAQKVKNLFYTFAPPCAADLEWLASAEPELSVKDIKSIKKRIKYAKTPMERKALEKQLNDIYKKRR